MKFFVITIVTCILSLAQAVEKKKTTETEHRHHGAHVHGAATLNIAFDQLSGRVEFKAASEGVLGFEHQAKSEKDKKKLAETTAQFESGMASMVKFADAAGCVLTKDQVEMVAEKEDHDSSEKKHVEHHGEHSDFVANFNVTCKSELKGSKLVLDFTAFKGLKDLDVTLLIGDLQKSVEVKGKPVTVELK